MSMLAERRRKTKWVINPTKKPIWTAESNGIKFGKELMEKMGWSAGKGLGANEQGIQEPLKVSYKNDTKGMGFKGNDDDWIEQQDEFNDLLNQLRSSEDSSVVKLSEEEKNEIKSLEEKSKLSKARVHYQKFTRGKDLSRYSENDLACILGTNKTKKEKPKTEEVVQNDVKTDGCLETSFGVTTINSGSIQDYFKKKWKVDKVHNVPKADEEHEGQNEECWRPCFSAKDEDDGKEKSKKKKQKLEDGSLCVNEAQMLDFDEKCKEKKKRKKEEDVIASVEEEPENKKRKKHSVSEELQDGVGEEVKECGTSLLGNENDCDLLKKRKKNKKQLKVNEECLEEKHESKVSFSTDSIKEMSSVENFNDTNEEGDLGEIKKKKKKEKKEKKQSAEREEEPVRKKKKEKNHVLEDVNKENIGDHISEVSLENDMVEEENAVNDKHKKKKKKHNDHCGGTDEQNLQGDSLRQENDIHESDALEMKSEKKKKKKGKQEGNEGVEHHSSQNGILSEIPAEKSLVEGNCTGELEQSKKKKKKKEKQDKEVENHSSQNGITSDIPVESICTEELEQNKKKKKKKEKQDKEVENQSNQNVGTNHIPEEKFPAESNCPDDLEQTKKKKKKDKHKTKGKEDSGSVTNQESHLEGTCIEDINGSSNVGAEIVKKKKKKDKKERRKSKDGSSTEEREETKECLDSAEAESPKKKKKKLLESEGDGEKKIETVDKEISIKGKINGTGNAEIGVDAVDKVEMITQRAAYEHVPGQHSYERVKAMIQFVNLQRFAGSNLEGLDGYGQKILRKCDKNVR